MKPNQTESKLRLTRLEDLLPEWEADATAAHTAFLRGEARGPRTGFPRLDQALGGWLQPGVHIAHGQPGVGKTGFGLQIAGSCGCPALFVSCEMNLLELLRRMTARVTETPLNRLKRGELPPQEAVALLQRAMAACPGLAFADSTREYADPDWLLDAAKAVREDARHVLVVVDSVHSWADSAPADAAEYERLNGALTALHLMTSELNCPVLAISERNRASMVSGGISAGAGSRKIEYGAETVLDLEVQPNTFADVTGETPMTVTLAKNRHGAPGAQVRLRFQGALQRFQEM